MDLGSRIVKLRKDNKMSQDDLAEVLNVTRQTISNWENHKNYPDIETLILISDKFNISLDILLKGDKKMVKKMDKKINFKLLRFFIIMLVIFVSIIMCLLYLYANVEFTMKYDENMKIIYEISETNKEWSLSLNTPICGSSADETAIIDNGEKKYIFINRKYTLSDYFDAKQNNFGPCSNETNIDYNKINYNDNIEIYYTPYNINDIRKASLDKLDELEANSILIFSNEKDTVSIKCTIGNKKYDYDITYYKVNKQIIESKGDEKLPEGLLMDIYSTEKGNYKSVWFTNDTYDETFNKIKNYFNDRGGMCFIDDIVKKVED